MSRLWLVPLAVPVTVVHQQPQQFRWKGTNHHILFIAQRWRLDLEWWRIRIWRDYYKVTTNSGLLVVIFHNLLTDSWYLERLYD